MNPINITKRMQEDTASLLKAADDPRLPAGLRLRIINIANRMNKHAVVASKHINIAHTRPLHADYDARTQEDMAAQADHKKEVWGALLAGKIVSLESNFQTSEFHTIICKIRHEIEDKHLPYVLCDEWHRPEGRDAKGNARRPFKKYWLETKEADNE